MHQEGYAINGATTSSLICSPPFLLLYHDLYQENPTCLDYLMSVDDIRSIFLLNVLLEGHVETGQQGGQGDK